MTQSSESDTKKEFRERRTYRSPTRGRGAQVLPGCDMWIRRREIVSDTREFDYRDFIYNTRLVFGSCVCVCVCGAHGSRVHRRPDPRESYTFPVTRACTYVLHAFWRARAIGIPRGPPGVLATGSKRRWEIVPINNGKVDSSESRVRERPGRRGAALIRRLFNRPLVRPAEKPKVTECSKACARAKLAGKSGFRRS